MGFVAEKPPADSGPSLWSTIKPPTPTVPQPRFYSVGGPVIGTPNDDVIAAILSGNTMVTRRAEIYNADGVTPFINDNGIQLTDDNSVRVISGDVNVSYSRVDRRNWDGVFDNSDGKLSHNPKGFWYDKIIKTFRGVKWENPNLTPKICFVGTDQTTAAVPVSMLRQMGFDRITFASTNDPNYYLDFDILVGYAFNTDLTVAQQAVLQYAYAAGQSILTICNYATSTSVPLIATVSTRSGSSNWTIADPPVDNPFIDAIYPYQVAGTTGETFPLTVRSSAAIAASSVYASTNGAAAVYEVATNGSRWFHYQPRIESTPLNKSYGRLRNVFLMEVINWLYGYQQIMNYECQTGEFMIDKIVQKRFPLQVEVTCRDYWKKLTLSQFYTSTTFTKGSGLDETVQAMAANAGITKFNLGSGNITIAADATFDRASDRGTAITALCQAANIEVFFDKTGYLVTRPFRDPSTSPATVSLRTGKTGIGNLVDWSKTSDDGQLYNIIVVTGENDTAAKTGTIYQGVARNDNPSSPTSTVNIGDRPYFYTSAFFTSNAQCQTYANTLLSVHALEQFQLDFTSLVFPWLEGGDIVEFDDPSPTIEGEPTRFLMTDFVIPSSLAPMTGTAKRLSIVGSA